MGRSERSSRGWWISLLAGSPILLAFVVPACTRAGYTATSDVDAATFEDGGPAINKTWCEGLSWVEASCQADGQCITVRTTPCDDDNLCAEARCLSDVGCKSAAKEGSCPSPDPCSSVGVCREGSCVAGVIDKDTDADGYIDATCDGGDDCDDHDFRVHPKAAESNDVGASCWDLRDNDCDGQLDDEEQACSKRRWRSVGVASGDLNTSAATVQIDQGQAAFERSLPDSVGVGDALVYVAAGNPHLAFIHGRLGASSFVVRGRQGQAPASCPAGTPVNIFRAYTSLAEWQQQKENPQIVDAVRDFDLDRDLVVAQAIMQVACYEDGLDQGNPTVDGWNTSPAYYVHIMTPRSAYEVGVSQRHSGTYGGYRLEPAAAGVTLEISVPHMRVEGLSIRGWPGGGSTVRASLSAQDVDFFFVNNVVDSNGNGDNNGTVQILAADAAVSGRVMVANNVVYGTPVAWSECFWLGNYENYAPLSYVLVNNSVVNCYRGYEARSTLGQVLATNNVAMASSTLDFYDNPAGSYSAASSHNCSSDATGGEIGTSAVTGVEPTTVYVSLTPGEEDLHLKPASACQGQGLNLHADPKFLVELDFEGELRPHSGPWDIGADQLLP